MKNNTHLLTLTIAMAVMACFGSKANAQLLNSNDVFYHSFNSPLQTRLNPAFFPYESTFYLTLPRIGMGFQMPFSYNDLGLKYDTQTDTTTVDLNHIINLIQEKGTWIGLNVDVDAIGFGFRIKNFFVNYASGVRVNSNLTVPLNALHLLTDGNTGQYATLNMGTTDFFVGQAYIYNSLGLSYTLPNIPLTVGARFNLLDGIQNVGADNLNLILTNEDNNVLRLEADYKANAAGIVKFERFQREGKEDSIAVSIDETLPLNLGYTFDIGAKYDLGKFSFSASLLDFGPGIQWTSNVKTVIPKHQNHVITFEGIDLSKVNITFDEEGNPVSYKLDSTYLQGFVDSLKSMIATVEDGESYWCGVPTRMYLGASYTLGRMLRVGALFHGEWNRGIFYTGNTFRHSTSLSATFNLFNWLEVSAANAITYDGNKMNFFSPGIGVSLNLFERLQFYSAVDYLSNLYATDIKAVRAYVGINFVNNVREKNKRKEAERKLEEERLAREALMAEADSLARAKAEAEARAKAEADSVAEANRLAMEAERAKAQAEADSIARANAEAIARAKAEAEAQLRAVQDSLERIKNEALAREQAIRDSIARAKEEQRVREEAAFVSGYKDVAYYETGKDMPIFSELNEDSWVNLKNVMDRNPNVHVVITGHTDNVGKPEKNLDLSKRRAENFKKILEGKGIDGNRITAIGKGQTEPIATNKTKEGRAKNRRIEVSISSQDE